MEQKIKKILNLYQKYPEEKVVLDLICLIQKYPEIFFDGSTEKLEEIFKTFYIPSSPISLPTHIFQRFCQSFGEGRPFRILYKADEVTVDSLLKSLFCFDKIYAKEEMIQWKIKTTSPEKVLRKKINFGRVICSGFFTDNEVPYPGTYETTLDYEKANQLATQYKQILRNGGDYKNFPLSEDGYDIFTNRLQTFLSVLFLFAMTKEIDQDIVDILSLLVGGYLLLGIDKYYSQQTLIFVSLHCVLEDTSPSVLPIENTK